MTSPFFLCHVADKFYMFISLSKERDQLFQIPVSRGLILQLSPKLFCGILAYSWSLLPPTNLVVTVFRTADKGESDYHQPCSQKPESSRDKVMLYPWWCGSVLFLALLLAQSVLWLIFGRSTLSTDTRKHQHTSFGLQASNTEHAGVLKITLLVVLACIH